MAKLVASEVNKRYTVGDRVQKTFRVTTGIGSAVEWIETGFTDVVSVRGFAILGPTPSTFTLNFARNAQGTGVAEGTNLGDLGVEAAAAFDVLVTVIGIA